MKYSFVILLGLLMVSCTPPKSKGEQTIDTINSLTEKYIQDTKNATTQDEARRLNREYNERVKFEKSKLSEQEMRETEQNTTWEQYQHYKQLQEEKDKTIQDTRKRLFK